MGGSSRCGSEIVGRDGTSLGFGQCFLWRGCDGVEGRARRGMGSVLPNPPSPRVVDGESEGTCDKVGKSQAVKTNCAMLKDFRMRTGEDELLCMMTLISPL